MLTIVELSHFHNGSTTMCRNIKTLSNFEPPASEEEIAAAAPQFIRKLSGTTKPSKRNEIVFTQAVEEITLVATKLLFGLETNAPPRNREQEKEKARLRNAKRFPAAV
jgi:hypothetical protein